MQYLLIEMVVAGVLGALRLSWAFLRVMWYFAGYATGVSVRLLCAAWRVDVEAFRQLRAAAVWQA
ncbi:MAG: hypothetical protein M1449_07025, partial [Candidatus Thermoplasmatota archaeon]|nr:hypothetical protein [Candidatus Thermoplasmatota archaeon]